MRRLLGFLALVGVCAVAGCGESSPASEGAPPPTGTIAPSTLSIPATPIPQLPARPKAIQPVFAAPTRPGALVDPDEAHTVAARLWNDHVLARYRRDLAGLATIESGAALEADVGYVCLSGCRGPLLSANQIVVNVRRQEHWPLVFSANASYTVGCTTSEPPCHDSFVVAQPAKGAAWKIVNYITYSGTTFIDQPTVLPDGWAEDPVPSAVLASAPEEYAAYLQSLSDTGLAPAGTQLASDWFGFRQSDVERALGFFTSHRPGETLAYLADPADGLWEFAGSNGAQFACGTIRFTDDIAASPGHPIVQSPALSPLGDHVRPGTYSHVRVQGVHMACFEQHVDETTATIVGEWGDVTNVTTTP